MNKNRIFSLWRKQKYGVLAETIASHFEFGFKHVYVLKNLNETRWPCRADAKKAIVFDYDFIKEALTEISKDPGQKDLVKIESTKIHEKMGQLEIAFYAIFRNNILKRFNSTNHILQDPKIVLRTTINALNYLILFVRELRFKFEDTEEKAKKISIAKDHAQTRYRKRNVRLSSSDNNQSDTAQMSSREKFRTESFIPVIDQLIVSLIEKIANYNTVYQKFGFLNNFEKLGSPELQFAADHLIKFTPMIWNLRFVRNYYSSVHL